MAKTTKSQARTKRERSEFLWGWLFILPTTIGLIVLNIIPIFQTIYQSFFKTGDFGKGNIIECTSETPAFSLIDFTKESSRMSLLSSDFSLHAVSFLMTMSVSI